MLQGQRADGVRRHASISETCHQYWSLPSGKQGTQFLGQSTNAVLKDLFLTNVSFRQFQGDIAPGRFLQALLPLLVEHFHFRNAAVSSGALAAAHTGQCGKVPRACLPAKFVGFQSEIRTFFQAQSFSLPS